MPRHCRICGQTEDECWCGAVEQDEDEPGGAWAGKGFSHPAPAGED